MTLLQIWELCNGPAIREPCDLNWIFAHSFFRPFDREPCDLNWIFAYVSVARSIVKISTENNANAKKKEKKNAENEAKQKKKKKTK